PAGHPPHHGLPDNVRARLLRHPARESATSGRRRAGRTRLRWRRRRNQRKRRVREGRMGPLGRSAERPAPSGAAGRIAGRAAGRREASLPRSGGGGRRNYMKKLVYSGHRGSTSMLVRSSPATHYQQRRYFSETGNQQALAQQSRDLGSFGVGGGSEALQERE